MQAIADHVYHTLIIAFVAATIVEAIVKFVKRPRKRKRAPVAPRESAIEREKRMRERGYRTKRVGFMVTFRLVGAEKSVLKLVGANLKDGQNVLVL